jgi:signal transduction histidine kinase
MVLFSIFLTGGLLLALVWFLLQKTVIQPVSDLTRTIASLRHGRQKSTASPSTELDEFGILQQEFTLLLNELDEARQRLTEINRQLQGKVDECRQSEEALKIHQAKLQELSYELLQIEEQERRRLASKIHDRIGQMLAIAKIQVGLLEKEGGAAPALTKLAEIRTTLENIIDDTRSLTFEISPPILYELGLEAAISWLAEEMSAASGLKIEVEACDIDQELPVPLRVMLFRSLRELLLNTVKHARATRAAVSIQTVDGSLNVIVQDNGIGYQPHDNKTINEKHGGFGLFSIRERVTSLKGNMEISAAPGRGTTVQFTLPLTPPERIAAKS